MSAARAQSLEELGRLSIEDLSKIQVTSVSKVAESAADAPAAIYVITGGDVLRSGVTALPDALRLAPNLEFERVTPSSYNITPRGLNGNSAAQNFANKLLVLIDGRIVYNPLYSGVYWDMQDVFLEDVDRIEVISGPGATLWGANAVNGVVNVTTRNSAETQGGILDLRGGSLESGAAFRYGGRLTPNLTYRLYAQDASLGGFETPGGANAHDGMRRAQGGFRVDWAQAGDLLTVQGDLHDEREKQPGAADVDASGGNLTAHWRHALDGGSAIDVLSYYDQTRRATAGDGGAFLLRNYDIEAQHDFRIGTWNRIVWGLGERISDYHIENRISPANSLLFVPAAGTLHLFQAFVEDRIALSDEVDVVAAIRVEKDPFGGWSPMPSVRASWRPAEGTLIWAAISRAVRTPTIFDTDVVEKLGAQPFLTGNARFQSEKVTAYEFGVRRQFGASASLSISAFDHEYEDLRNIEITPKTFLPIFWANGMEGRIYGVEGWGSYQVAAWWRLSAGLTLQREDLRFRPGASTLLGLAQAGDDPREQASLRSSFDLVRDLSLEADLRYVGALHDPRVAGFWEANARLAWSVSDALELSLSGSNLLHASHVEFTTPPSDRIPRSVLFEARWKF